MITTLLFDLDGTLVDTARDFHQILNTMRSEQSLPPAPYELIRSCTSDGTAAMINAAFNITEADAQFTPLKEDFLNRYENSHYQHAVNFSGINDLLNFAKSNNMQWGVVTNKPARFAEPLMRQIKFPLPYKTVICPDHVREKKPNPESLFLACEQSLCKPNEAIYIGDHKRDIAAGKNAHMLTIAAAWGYLHPKDDINNWQASYIAHTPFDVIDILQKIQETHSHV